MANSDGHCIFEYLYRDASNYKVGDTLLLTGHLSEADEAKIKACLDAGIYFVAEQVGIPPLYEPLWALSDGPTDDDHAFHEFIALRHATKKERNSLPIFSDLQTLIKTFQSVSSWDCFLSPNCI
ncbi:MAG: hypothetical protein RBS75_04320 [Methylophilaceae bacterium]|jgi:hypothetical protein|nr:hypothetical protein [Methylophilaceae bacterium]